MFELIILRAGASTLYVEVKTTMRDDKSVFPFSLAEAACAHEQRARYVIYFVYLAPEFDSDSQALPQIRKIVRVQNVAEHLRQKDKKLMLFLRYQADDGVEERKNNAKIF
jgi:hypothetical protein